LGHSRVGAIQHPGAESEPRELRCSVGGVPVMRAVRRAVRGDFLYSGSKGGTR